MDKDLRALLVRQRQRNRRDWICTETLALEASLSFEKRGIPFLVTQMDYADPDLEEDA